MRDEKGSWKRGRIEVDRHTLNPSVVLTAFVPELEDSLKDFGQTARLLLRWPHHTTFCIVTRSLAVIVVRNATRGAQVKQRQGLTHRRVTHARHDTICCCRFAEKTKMKRIWLREWIRMC